MKFRISLDEVHQESKPNRDIASVINNRIGGSAATVTDHNIESIVTNIGRNGHTFCPATFRNGVRTKDTFEQMQLLVLDFDGGVSKESVFNRADEYNLPVLFSYSTFNSTDDHPKFRIGFLNDAPLTDVRIAKLSQNLLYVIFPEADKSCIGDAAKMYYGSNASEVPYINRKMPTVDIESLNRNATLCMRHRYGDTHYKNHIKMIAKRNGVKLTSKNLLDISVVDDTMEMNDINGKNSPTAIIVYNNADGEELPTQYYRINMEYTGHSIIGNANNSDGIGGTLPTYGDRKSNRIHKLRRSSFIGQVRQICQLFRQFDDGSSEIHHEALFGLATTLINIESGHDLFLSNLQKYAKYPSYVSKYEYWSKNMNYISQQGYVPMRCSHFCPYRDKCKHGVNILTTTDPKGIEVLLGHEQQFYSIDEAVADLNENLKKAIASKHNYWYIIKAQTSIGKTELYLRCIKGSSKRFLISVPTNALKRDVYERAVAMGIDMIMSPSLHEIKDELPDEVWGHIQELYDKGMYSSVNTYIRKVLAQKDIPCLKEHLEKKEKFDNSSGHAIITHKRLCTMDEKTLRKYDMVVVDEDILLKSVISDKKDITVSDLKKLRSTLPRNNKLAKRIGKMLHMGKTETFFEMPQLECEWDEEDAADTPTAIDVPAFCMATHFCFRRASDEPNLEKNTISFFRHIEFPDAKYIMLSATVNEKICRYYFGADKVKLYECKKARYLGMVIQYADRSYSRACIEDNPGIIDRITRWTGSEYLITFKKYAKGGELYLNKTEGIDTLRGKMIDIVGTPHSLEFIYKLFAYSLGLEFDERAELKSQIVTHENKYRFRFKTYNDNVLRNIQFWIISSELEQAVGRARLLRFEKGEVHLFSNFPVDQAVFADPQYDKCDVKIEK